MSGASESLARRIAGAKDLSSVVRSMKALAASSITQYQRAVESLKAYSQSVESGLAVCLRESASRETPAKRRPSVVARGVIVFGSDQGLVGRFNESLMEFVDRALPTLAGKTTHLWVVGERMRDAVTDPGLPAPVTLAVPHSIDSIAGLVGEILLDITRSGLPGDMSEIHLFHNQPSGEGGYAPVGRRLLPLDASWQRDLAARPWPDRGVPEVVGALAPTLQALVREHLFVLLFAACAESLAAENASRLAGMQRAEDNIAKSLEGLIRIFHRTRQSSIDEELFDVVAGYESLTRKTG